MKLHNLKIGQRLLLGFSVVLLLMVCVSIFAMYQMSILTDTTENLYNHPLTVSNALRDVEIHVTKMHRSMKDVMLASDDVEMETAVNAVALSEREVYNRFNIIEERYLGNIRDVEELKNAFIQWKPIRDEAINLWRAGEKEKASAITQGKGQNHIDLLEREMQDLTDFASNKAIEFLTGAHHEARTAYQWTAGFLMLAFALGIGIALAISRSITGPLRMAVTLSEQVSQGNLGGQLEITSHDEIGQLLRAMNSMIAYIRDVAVVAGRIADKDLAVTVAPKSEYDVLNHSLQRMVNNLQTMMTELEQSLTDVQEQNWIRTGQAELGEMLRGEQELSKLAKNIITYLAKYLQAQVGTIYFLDDEHETPRLKLAASYAFIRRKGLHNEYGLGEGLIGQAALEKECILYSDIPEDYISINSGLGETIPRHILVVPFLFEGEVKGIVELATSHEFSEKHLEFSRIAQENIGVAINSMQTRERIQILLHATQQQAAELQAQQEELRAANEELEAQTMSLKASEQKLKQQQEELEATNEELEEKTQDLERQKVEIIRKNTDLETARQDIEIKAKELEITSKYKSEFLANMSHELRTPLNSLLILARSFAENKEHNLSDDQVEAAQIIYKSGRDLLNLINEILDLSKIESGKMTLNVESVEVKGLAGDIHTHFKHIAEERGIELQCHVDQDVPESIQTDRQRLEQILKNLLSNAIKFTHEGGVTIMFHRPASDTNLSRSGLNQQTTLAISVKDSGIGIPQEKQLEIFEAFQQVDGSTSRKYGGTGLGLSISRELAKLLGGEIQLESIPGSGSTFTLFVPVESLPAQDEAHQIPKKDASPSLPPMPVQPAPVVPPEVPVWSPYIPDDRDSLQENEHAILIIEDDPNFAKILRDQCRAKGFKCLAAESGEAGLHLAGHYAVQAIILDIKLPGMDGWSVLDILKTNTATRHIPVHLMSAYQEDSSEMLKKGVVGFLAKPAEKENIDAAFRKLEHIINKEIKDLLIVEDDAVQRKRIIELIGNGDVSTTEATNGQEAAQQLKSKNYDCMILDFRLPDTTGLAFLQDMTKEQVDIPPVIVYTVQEISKADEQQLLEYCHSVIIKGEKSEERLLDDTTLFLHRVVNKLPRQKQKMINRMHDKELQFDGKHILLVDDDMRNVFALTKELEGKGMKVFPAEDGQKALDILQQEVQMDLVLMDLMMPVMDGYETIKAIRKQPQFARLPVIALTAKAMKGEREKCLEIGASDYLMKPVDVDRLFAMMQIWLYA